MRAFLAIDIPGKFNQEITNLQRELPAEGIKPISPENLHITLKFLGEIDEDMGSDLKQALARLKPGKIKISLKGIGVFPSREYIRVIWIGCESPELLKLGEEINELLFPIGFKKENFSPHITIARAKRKVNISNFLDENENIEIGEFKAKEIKLKKSTLFPKGPVYETVDTFPL